MMTRGMANGRVVHLRSLPGEDEGFSWNPQGPEDLGRRFTDERRVVRVTAECGQDFAVRLTRDGRGAPVLAWYAGGGREVWTPSKIVPVRLFLRHPRREPFRIAQQPLRASDLYDLQGWAADAWRWEEGEFESVAVGVASIADLERTLWDRAAAAEDWLLGRGREGGW